MLLHLAPFCLLWIFKRFLRKVQFGSIFVAIDRISPQWHFSHRVTALSLHRMFSNSPLLFVHTEPSSSGVKPHQCVIPTAKHCCGSKRGMTVHAMMSVCFPHRVYPLTVSDHTDAVIMCCDPPCILESDKVMFLALNYIIAISKWNAVCLSHVRGGRLFSGVKFPEASVRRADHCRDFFPR